MKALHPDHLQLDAHVTARTLPQAYLLMLGSRHQLSPAVDEVVLQRHWPGALFCFLSLRVMRAMICSAMP